MAWPPRMPRFSAHRMEPVPVSGVADALGEHAILPTMEAGSTCGWS